ncbi:hypothetical protein SAMN02745857_01068 [Andreprevotia lacus DSM 23236]|uniref:SnoaL-like domain-containing protein n=1 Tax=Andreprevotia lacus DSM 23236 TaxID=1121001 RepID=A0A1W1XAK9_9NEIS|nr:hypothetical protein [Andreprevotia lacus]SMC20887.1 hypothetical protein SAMN02745857_01068 [Andreprevotia lacus DSM 23236]
MLKAQAREQAQQLQDLPNIGKAMPADLADFVARYCAAFNALDGAAIAALYAVPSAIAHGSSYTHWTDAAAITANMAALCTLYRDGGYVAASYTVAHWWPQGPDHAVLDVAWHITREGDLPPWQFHTGYNLLRGEHGWLVRLCTAYEEARLDA